MAGAATSTTRLARIAILTTVLAYQTSVVGETDLPAALPQVWGNSPTGRAHRAGAGQPFGHPAAPHKS